MKKALGIFVVVLLGLAAVYMSSREEMPPVTAKRQGEHQSESSFRNPSPAQTPPGPEHVEGITATDARPPVAVLSGPTTESSTQTAVSFEDKTSATVTSAAGLNIFTEKSTQ